MGSIPFHLSRIESYPSGGFQAIETGAVFEIGAVPLAVRDDQLGIIR
jgi:hypothetical protein